MHFDQLLQQIVNGIQRGQHLRAYRARLHDGLWRPAPDQLRPRRCLHARVIHRFLHGARDESGGQPTLGAALVRLFPILLIAMAACAFLGVIIERLAYRPLRNQARLTALITAIGVSLFLENAAQLVFTADSRTFPPVTPQGAASTMHLGGITISKDQLVLVLTAFALMAVLTYIVQYTRIGKAMRAVQHDMDAASLMGINTDRIIGFTFGLGAALAGAGGVLFASLTYTSILPLMGVQMGLKAFVAAVVGGIGSIPGAMLGGLLMGIAENLVKGAPSIGSVEPSRWTDAVAFVLLIVVLLVRPSRVCSANPARRRYNLRDAMKETTKEAPASSRARQPGAPHPRYRGNDRDATP